MAKVVFHEGEEYKKIQFQFLISLLMMGGILSFIFIFLEVIGLNALGSTQFNSTLALFACSIGLLALIREDRRRYRPIAWTFEAACFLTFISAFIFVPQDELRVVWFYVNIPAAYILLGRFAGAAITLATLLTLPTVNHFMDTPLSRNALTTFSLSLIAVSIVFYAFTDRTIWFFKRMVASNRRLRDLAMRDPLTGLLNARAFYAVGDMLIKLARRNNAPFSMLFVDLDHFKSINDRYGHAVGDVVLRDFAASLARHVRKSDVVGRVGGEEFALLLPDTDQTGAVALAELLRRTTEAMIIRVGENTLSITASIGVATNAAHHRNIADIQKEADLAAYAAKRLGRNRVASFDGDCAMPLNA